MELPDRDERDDDAARLVLLLMLRHRLELEELLGDPAELEAGDLQGLGDASESYWERVEAETADTLGLILLATFLASARLHGVSGTAQELAANAAGANWSRQYADGLAGRLTETSRKYLAELTAQWQQRIAAGETLTAAGVDEDLLRIFGGKRAAVIAVDVVTTGQTAGGEWAVNEFAQLSEQDTWITRDDGDVCQVCEPLNDEPRSVWSREFPSGAPAHPLCRCYIVYVSVSTI